MKARVIEIGSELSHGRVVVDIRPKTGPMAERNYQLRCPSGHRVWVSRWAVIRGGKCSNCAFWITSTPRGRWLKKTKILAKTKGGNFKVQCRCGNKEEVTPHALYNRIREGSGCMQCRVKPVDAKCSGCGAPVKRSRNVVPRARCDRCRRTKANETHRRGARRRAMATLGRECVGCKRGDHETIWSPRVKACGACCRQGERNGWCPCGSPLKKDKGFAVCRAGCV